MSIVGLLADVPLTPPPTLAPTTLPSSAPATAHDVTALLLAAGGYILFALLVAWSADVFRRRSIAGPPRLPPDRPLVPLLTVTLIGATAWLAAQGLLMVRLLHAHPGQTFSEETLSARDMALLSVAPACVGLMVLLIADAM